ncbi:MAG: prepilin peptidase [Thermoanaerobaculia bacterium]|nr:prepilin peptidase [Thermoanaerobaculia bacterium]
MGPQLLFDLYVLLVGLIVGSYLNVVIHRLPRRRSTVLPRSRCPSCGARIRARDNIPLLSFLLLGGRCRSCGRPISLRYPLVEALTAALFVGSLERFGPEPEMVIAVGFGCLLITLAGIDYEHYLLPDLLTLPGLGAGLLLAVTTDWISWREALLGAVLGAGVSWIFAEGWFRLRGEEGLGLGDVKMLGMIGAFLGWSGVLVTLFLASLTGTLVGAAFMIGDRMDLKSRLPFGVFLALGGLVALFFGPPLVGAYRSLLLP